MTESNTVEEYRKYLQTLSQRELFQAYNNVDRKRYPDRYNLIRQEISEREVVAENNKPVEQADQSDKMTVKRRNSARQEMKLNFNGSAKDYFRIWIVNLSLTLLTFGIFSAWAKVRKRRYIYSHLTIDGTPFQYLAQPIPILKGRLIAGAVFLVYYITSHFFVAQLPYVLVAGLVIAPWVMIQSAAFNARYTAFRNISFCFDGTYLEALRVISAWGIVPAFVVGIFFDWWDKPWLPAILIGILSLLFPWWLQRIKNFIVSRTSYGEIPGSFSATGGNFFRVYFVAGLIMTGVGIVAGGIGAATVAIAGKGNINLKYVTIAALIPMYAGYLLAFAYIQANMTNTVWNNIRLGPVKFHSTLASMDLIKLYITNALGIIFSAGLLIPWAVIRTIKYRADQTSITHGENLNLFKGSPATTVAATGSELSEFFDMDLSI